MYQGKTISLNMIVQFITHEAIGKVQLIKLFKPINKLLNVRNIFKREI